jgi:hypothetical protein
MVADPDKPCPHEDFEVWAEVNRLSSTEGGPVDAFAADIKINCANCGESFRWIGLEAGLMPSRPMVSVDETQLRAPIRPASADPDFGLGIPGFAVRMRLPRLPGGCWWGSPAVRGYSWWCAPRGLLEF